MDKDVSHKAAAGYCPFRSQPPPEARQRPAGPLLRSHRFPTRRVWEAPEHPWRPHGAGRPEYPARPPAVRADPSRCARPDQSALPAGQFQTPKRIRPSAPPEKAACPAPGPLLYAESQAPFPGRARLPEAPVPLETPAPEPDCSPSCRFSAVSRPFPLFHPFLLCCPFQLFQVFPSICAVVFFLFSKKRFQKLLQLSILQKKILFLTEGKEPL